MRDVRDKPERACRVRTLLRLFLLITPALAVLVVALSWFVLGRERAVTAARVYAGPPPSPDNLGQSPVAFRVYASSSYSGVETPRSLPIEVQMTAAGRSWSAAFASDAAGIASVNLPFDAGPATATRESAHIRLVSGERLLAEGDWLVVEPFLEHRQAGSFFLEDTTPRGLSVGLSLAFGVLAVPFKNELGVELTRDGHPLGGIPVRFSFDGAEVQGAARSTTDDQGRVAVALRAMSHHISVQIQFLDAIEGAYGQQFDLPVVAGAMHASLEGLVLTVQAPVPREVAYVNVVNARRTLWVGTVPLRPTPVGGTGSVTLPALPGPLWALTSSEFDLQSMALVGWPVGEPRGRSTLERRDRLVLDGFATARAEETARQSRVRNMSLIVALLATFVEVLLFLAYVSAQNGLSSHQPAELSAFVGKANWATAVAVVLLVVGFASLAWLVAVRH